MRSILHRVSAVMIAALSAVMIASPSLAQAAEPSTDEIRTMLAPPGAMDACPTDQNVRWSGFFGGSIYVGVRYTVVSSTPAFYASDGRAVDNLLNDSISAVFTSSVSRTTRLTVTGSQGVQLQEVLQTEVSLSIVIEQTTAIGVNVTAVVPPRTRVTGIYGVDGYDVVFDTQAILRQGTTCHYYEAQRSFTEAPTFVEGWRFTSTPL